MTEVTREKNKRRAREWRKAKSLWVKEDSRNRHLLDTFGLTPDEYDVMFEKQGGVCAICLEPEKVKRNGKVKNLAVDHDHETGAIRGLLCHHCNVGIGHLKDSPVLLLKASEYLSSSIRKQRRDLQLVEVAA